MLVGSFSEPKKTAHASQLCCFTGNAPMQPYLACIDDAEEFLNKWSNELTPWHNNQPPRMDDLLHPLYEIPKGYKMNAVDLALNQGNQRFSNACGRKLGLS
jgi:hypothetical protein